MRTFVFVDASNLFYGGEKSLGWKIDFKKLYKYLEERFGSSKIYYFGGVDIHDFPFDYLINDTVPLEKLERYLVEYVEKNKENLTGANLALFDRHLKQVRFYKKIEKFGYQLVLKPVKMYRDEEGNQKRKANCDVEMVFYLMREKISFDRAIILSGDGDFLPVLKYLRDIDKKEVSILARGPRTAKEIRQFAGDKFMDFEYLRERLKRTDLPNGR